MSLETIISDDQAAIATAQSAVDAATAALNAANVKLAADQAALSNAQPIVSLLAQIEGQSSVLDEATRTALLSLIAQAKALF